MLTRESEVIKAFDDYRAATGLAVTTIGQRVSTDPRMYDRLTKGGMISPRTYLRVMGWFERNTPEAQHG